MQVVSINYQHEPGLSLLLVPETEVERTLLLSMWKHGRLELCNGVADNTYQGYAITTREKSDVEEPVDE